MRVLIRGALACAIIAAAGPALAFSVKVDWGSGAGCSGVAPAFTLSRVPAGTAKLSFQMVDLNLPSYQHGGGEAAFTGKSAFAPGEAFGGMFPSYRGPCPPPGETHRYEWTVRALDATGKIIGAAKAVLPFRR